MDWRWMGGFTVRFTWAGGTGYVDPFDMKEGAVRADLVLLTNPRAGHTSPEDLEAILAPGGLLAGPADALARAARPGRALAAGEEIEIAGLAVSAVPAANRELGFFPRAAGWLGYLLDDGETRLFHAGATDPLPEHAGLRADVAFVPVSGRYLMGADEARGLADTVGAPKRVALHLVGDRFAAYEGFSVT